MVVATAVPTYKLYGEQDAWPAADMVHCEPIATRSSLHNWHIKPHRHVGLFQLLYLEQGKARVQLDEHQQRMQGGQLLAVPQSCIHGFQFQRNAVGCVITIAHPLAQKLLSVIGGGLLRLTQPRFHILSADEDSAQVRLLLGAFVREYRDPRAFRNELMETLLAALLIDLSRHMLPLPQAEAGPAPGRHFARFCELVEEGYASHRAVPDYANELGITAAHLNLICRQAAGKSALELIHERLLMEAKRSLVYTSMSIAEVSYAIGFSDPAYFTRFFKQRTGVGPKEFRREAELRNART